MHIDAIGQRPAISVIIPTLNAGPELRTLLERLWSQTLRPAEIIVVDSSSIDGSAELAGKMGAKVLCVDQAEYDHGGTRNFAASQASGEILVFMTQDALPANEDLLKKLIKTLEDETVCFSYARQLPKRGAGLLEQLSRSYNYPPQSVRKSLKDVPDMGIKTFLCSNVCAAIRRDLFVQLGQFQAPVIFNEDLLFAAKAVLAGYSVVYTAEAAVLHSHNYSARQQFQRFFDNGVSMTMNTWIRPYSSVYQAGSKLLQHQLRGIAERRAWRWVPVLTAELGAKYLGYQLGKKYRRLPNFLCRRFSMHRAIWDKLHTSMGTGRNVEG